MAVPPLLGRPSPHGPSAVPRQSTSSAVPPHCPASPSRWSPRPAVVPVRRVLRFPRRPGRPPSRSRPPAVPPLSGCLPSPVSRRPRCPPRRHVAPPAGRPRPRSSRPLVRPRPRRSTSPSVAVRLFGRPSPLEPSAVPRQSTSSAVPPHRPASPPRSYPRPAVVPVRRVLAGTSSLPSSASSRPSPLGSSAVPRPPSVDVLDVPRAVTSPPPAGRPRPRSSRPLVRARPRRSTSPSVAVRRCRPPSLDSSTVPRPSPVRPRPQPIVLTLVRLTSAGRPRPRRIPPLSSIGSSSSSVLGHGGRRGLASSSLSVVQTSVAVPRPAVLVLARRCPLPSTPPVVLVQPVSSRERPAAFASLTTPLRRSSLRPDLGSGPRARATIPPGRPRPRHEEPSATKRAEGRGSRSRSPTSVPWEGCQARCHIIISWVQNVANIVCRGTVGYCEYHIPPFVTL